MRRSLVVLFTLLLSISFARVLYGQTNPITEFVPPDGAENAFGYETAVNGYYAYIQAPDQSGGAVYMYLNNAMTGGTGWSEVWEQRSPDSDATYFGNRIAADGSTLVVADDGIDGNAGAVYVYTRIGNTLKLTKKLVEPTPGSNHYFGNAIAISGQWMVITAPVDFKQGQCGMANGVAYLYQNTGSGWDLVREIEESCTSAQLFGTAVAIVGPTLPGSGASGVEIAISDIAALNVAGQVYLYQITGSSSATFSSFATVVPPDAASSTGSTPPPEFGFALSLGSDGTLVVGAPFAYSNEGRAYIFTQQQTAPGVYSMAFASELSNNQSSSSTQGEFGTAVALAAFDRVAVGAPNQNNGAGQVVTYQPNAEKTAWTTLETFNPCSSNSSNQNGLGVSLTPVGADILVGPGFEDYSGIGSALLYSLNAPSTCH